MEAEEEGELVGVVRVIGLAVAGYISAGKMIERALGEGDHRRVMQGAAIESGGA